MAEINNLVYFLNSIKDILPFKDEADFRKKIKENKEFRIKVQKLVYLSKFFGWNNPYIFTLAERGPYSVELKQDYLNENLFDNVPERIIEFNKNTLTEFSSNKTLLYFEASATLLYAVGKKIKELSEEECVLLIQSLKQHIPHDIIVDAYHNIKSFKIFVMDSFISKKDVENLEYAVINDMNYLDEYFERYETSNNQIIVQGTIDYMRIALRESNLNLNEKYKLLMFINRYLTIIKRISIEITPDEFIDLNLDNLEEIFDQFQEYVSEELKIIKKIDDDDFDETLFY